MPASKKIVLEQAPGGPNTIQIVKLTLAGAAEFAATLMHYVTYSQTMTLMPGTYLVDIAGLGWLFAAVPDMTINHLLALFLAAATVAAPVFGFLYLMRERVIVAPGEFFAYKPNCVYAAALAGFWGLMIALELTNTMMLIDSFLENPFTQGQAATVLRDHRELAILSAVVVVIVNHALALATARLWFTILDKEG